MRGGGEALEGGRGERIGRPFGDHTTDSTQTAASTTHAR